MTGLQMIRQTDGDFNLTGGMSDDQSQTGKMIFAMLFGNASGVEMTHDTFEYTSLN